MATQKTNTLQIKNFKGVDRFVEGTESQPDVFYQIQNMNTPNPGELRGINGVTKLNPSAIPGVYKIVHAQFLDTQDEKDLAILYVPLSTAPAAPTGYTFSTSGGASVNYDLYVEYVFQGGGRIGTAYLATPIQANGLTITLPVSIDPLVICINYWVAIDADDFMWCGSSYRENGSFPITSVISKPNGAGTYVSPIIVAAFPSAKATLTSGTGGSLQSNRTYYLGIGPWASMATGYYGGVSFYSSGQVTGGNIITPQIFSSYVPDGNNKIDFLFDFCPYDLPNSNASPISSTVAMSKAIVYMGTSPEDLMPCGSTLGNAAPFTKTQVTATLDANANSDIVNNTLTITGYQVPVGALLGYFTGTGSVTGLVSGSYYYVRSAVYSSSGTTVTVSNTPTGAPVGLTAHSAAGTTVTLRWSKVSGTILGLPKEMDLIASCGEIATNNSVQPIAIAGRYAGYSNLMWSSTWNKTDNNAVAHITPATSTIHPFKIGCMTFSSKDPTVKRHCLCPTIQQSVNLTNYRWIAPDAVSTDLSDLVLSNFAIPLNRNFYLSTQSAVNSNPAIDYSSLITFSYQCRQYANRLWYTNDFNEPFYTNGYVFKSGIPTDATSGNTFARWPITGLIEFFQNRMILASAASNNTYQQGYVYISSILDVSDFNYVGTTPQTFPVNTSDQSLLVGLNVYSQDLSTVGADNFLVIGKQNVVFVWGGNLTTPAKQISKNAGFASPNAYALTKFGPVFVSRDNVFLFRSSQDVIPIGDPIKSIIKDLTSTQLSGVVAYYHDEDIKLGYSTDVDINAELWLRLRYNQGGIDRVWSGPHIMKPYQGVCSINQWNSELNVRVSYLDTNLYQRDDPGSYLNDTQPIDRAIKIINLGLQQDHLLKLINWVYLATRTVQDENFDLTLESQDGSQSIVVSATQTSGGNVRRILQVPIPQRFLARVFSLTVENSSTGSLSIYDSSILFDVLRRRLIP